MVQRRVLTQADDDEDAGETHHHHHISASSRDAKERPKRQSVLSFETDEDEGEVFQVKKSMHSKRVLRMYDKERQRKREVKINEKDDAAAAAAATTRVQTKKEIVTDDLVLVINSNHQRPITPPTLILSGRDALCAGKDDLSSEDDNDDDDGKTAAPRHRFSKPDNVKSVLESGAIPDAAMIHAARKKRQRARELGDFIPTEDAEEEQQQQQPEDTGRLLREDEHDGSDEERIDMNVNHTIKEQEKRREQFLSVQHDSDDNVDDEWEDQQIRKGVTSAVNAAVDLQLLYSEPRETWPQQILKTVVPAIEPGIVRTPQMISDKLREHLKSLHQSGEANRRRLATIEADVVLVDEELGQLKARTPLAADKFKFYQELRGYVTDLVECLDEKVAAIAELERRAIDAMARRAFWLVERRRQDVCDQAEEVSADYAEPATKEGGGGGGGDAEKRLREQEEKVKRAAEREGRRTRRRRARELRAAELGTVRHVEGMSSDDEETIDHVHDGAAHVEAQLEAEARAVFGDVVDDYSSLAGILVRFEQWRERDAGAYRDAYATLCLPKVASPLVRLELLLWNPLLPQSFDFDKLDWYRTVALYGLHEGPEQQQQQQQQQQQEEEASLAGDPDVNLLPVLVEKVIVPKLTVLVERCWDPLSSGQTLRLIGLVTRCIRRYPTLGPGSRPLENLFHGVLHKMKLAVEHDVFIPTTGGGGGGGTTTTASPAAKAFFNRQFASGVKLLKNISSWQGVLNDAALKELALGVLLNRYLLPAINNSTKWCGPTDAAHKMRLISLILPRVYLHAEAAEPHLDMFATTALSTFDRLDRTNPLHIESVDMLAALLKTIGHST